MNNLPIHVYPFSFLLLISSVLFSQNEDSLKIKQSRKIFYTASAVAYTSSISSLYFLWYKDIPSQKFHFFDDSNQWLGMDKLGHTQTSWATSSIIFDQMKSLGQTDENAFKAAIIIPQVFMTTIELFDGFSSAWGFSWTDIGANVLGSGLFYIQQKKFGYQPIQMKYSYSQSGLAGFRPAVLGNSFAERMLKDYSGNWQKLEQKWPSWLCLSIGMGGRNMLGGTRNSWTDIQGNTFDYTYLNRYREWSFSFDIDLRRIPIRGKFWKTFSSMFCWLKIPSPALTFSKQNGFHARPLYY